MSSYVFRKTSDDASIYDLFSHLVPIVTSLGAHIGVHEVADPKPRRVFISQRLMRLVTLLRKLRNQLHERFQLDHRSELRELVFDCEEEICLLLDEMEGNPELNFSEHAMPEELLGMLWTLNDSLRNYYHCIEARSVCEGLPTSKEAEVFGRAQVAQLIASEARHSYQTRATIQELPISGMESHSTSPDPQPVLEALTSRDIQQLVTQIRMLQLEVTELKTRQRIILPPPPRILDPILEHFLAAQHLPPVELTPSMRSYATSIPAPPYALSDVGAKDCVGERYDNAPVPLHVEFSEDDGEPVTLRRSIEGNLTLNTPAGRGVTLRRLTQVEAEATAITALVDQCRQLDYL